MGRLIAVLAIAGAAALPAHPGSNVRARANAAPAAKTAAPAAPSASVTATTAAAERDFARRQAEVALSGSAPLFGAEGLPKPLK
jgi:hypothetical protein